MIQHLVVYCCHGAGIDAAIHPSEINERIISMAGTCQAPRSKQSMLMG